MPTNEGLTATRGSSPALTDCPGLSVGSGEKLGGGWSKSSRHPRSLWQITRTSPMLPAWKRNHLGISLPSIALFTSLLRSPASEETAAYCDQA